VQFGEGTAILVLIFVIIDYQKHFAAKPSLMAAYNAKFVS